jgi:hypothetical protein
MPQPTHTPTGTFPDLDGTLGDGPLQIQATGEVFSSAILIKSADPAMGLMCKLIDACDWLKKNMTAAADLSKLTASSGDTLIGVLTYAGRFLTLPTGTLRTVLQYIANNAITDAPSSAVTNTLAAVGISYYTAREYHVIAPTEATMTITLVSTSPIPPEGAELTLSAYSIANTKNVILEREDASQIIIMTGLAAGQNFGSATLKFIGGVWRLKSATGLASQWAASWPGSMNNP